MVQVSQCQLSVGHSYCLSFKIDIHQGGGGKQAQFLGQTIFPQSDYDHQANLNTVLEDSEAGR
mgnify:CR=1 FL=1